MRIAHSLLHEVAVLGRTIVARPLGGRELTAAAIILLAGGTLYCALYCQIAYYPMHAGAMPLWLSAWWAATSLLPWLAAFELVKRVAPRVLSAPLRFLAWLLIAVAAAAVTVLAYWAGEIETMGMGMTHWSTLIASQMQPAVVFVILIGVWTTGSRNAERLSDADSHSDTLPALAMIDWIRAAGNYVELKCGDRLLIRRMTMRSAEAATRSADFLRIHRSVIVRKPLIRGFAGTGRPRVLLTTGETLPVGDSYRPAVERLVPSSQDLALRPIGL
jgi:hypothetical protein